MREALRPTQGTTVENPSSMAQQITLQADSASDSKQLFALFVRLRIGSARISHGGSDSRSRRDPALSRRRTSRAGSRGVRGAIWPCQDVELVGTNLLWI